MHDQSVLHIRFEIELLHLQGMVTWKAAVRLDILEMVQVFSWP